MKLNQCLSISLCHHVPTENEQIADIAFPLHDAVTRTIDRRYLWISGQNLSLEPLKCFGSLHAKNLVFQRISFCFLDSGWHTRIQRVVGTIHDWPPGVKVTGKV
jgi:hypothetical protein